MDLRVPSAALPAVTSVVAVSAGFLFMLPFVDLGPLSSQMVLHIVLMNIAAPLVGAAVMRYSGLINSSKTLYLIASLQMGALWAAHAPSVLSGLAGSPALELMLHIALASASVAFWACVLSCMESGRWAGVLVLLLTGKLACLLGGLLTFAPRDIYELPQFVSVLCTTGPSTLADQQLAGLIMIVSCPLSYLVAAIVMSGHMLAAIDQTKTQASEI
jgi:putative membrane protein